MKNNFEINSILIKLDWDFDKIKPQSCVTFLNPYSYLLLRNKGVIEKMDFIGIDGGLLKTIVNMSFNRNIQRISFDNTSLAPNIYNHCVKNSKSIYLIGSTSPNINKFIKILKNDYPDLNIAGYRNGYFKNKKERLTIIKSLIKLNPCYVIVGMGTPFQENFILDLKENGFKGISFTCGGYFHQTTNKTNYYPDLVNKYNLRWMYRIIDEPKLFKRYMLYYPKSLYYIFIDIVKHKWSN